MRELSAGRVGRAHGRDGSFYVEAAAHSLEEGTEVKLRGRAHRIERRGGTAERPLVRISDVDDASAAATLRGEPLLVEGDLGDGEFLAADLEGCRVDGLGAMHRVRRLLDGPSCTLLELDDETLVPLVSDAIRRVDLDARVIEVDSSFLGLES